MYNKNIDYSFLSKKITKQDINEFKRTHPEVLAQSSPLITAFISLIFVFIAVMCVGMMFVGQGGAMSFVLGGLFLTFEVLILLAVLKGIRTRKAREVRMYSFALANAMQFFVNKDIAPYVGTIFKQGYSGTITETLIVGDGREIGNFKYVTGSGKSRSEHNWGYVQVKLSRKLPHLMLDSKANNIMSSWSNLPVGFSKDQTVKLEGDFNEHFTVYAPEQYQQDARYVFTPDVMAALVDSAANFDIEVIDDILIFYSSNILALDSEVELRKIIELTQKVSTELIDQTEYYADERVGDRTANVIAAPGRRLKTRISVWTIITLVFVFIYFIFATWHEF
ncbi:MAG: hypothetical protein WAQ27_00890 [Candidatus Microsaccharimonas sp.]